MSEKKGTSQVFFRAGDLQPALEERTEQSGSIGRTARRDLERYYRLLQPELASLNGKFSSGEFALMLDVANGMILDSTGVALFWANVDDACRNGLDKAHEVAGPSLVEKLRGLRGGQLYALIDALERWWKGDYHREITQDSIAGLGVRLAL